LWHRLVDAVGRVSAFMRSYLLEAHPVSLTKNIFTIGFSPEFEEHIGLVDNPRNHALLQTKLGEFGHHGVQIKFVKAERPVGWADRPIEAPAEPTPAAAPAPTATAKPAAASATPQPPKERPVSTTFDKEEFKNDPLIKKALEVFKGQIIEIRG
jgi:DNA polymerase-3 subunit gamma/tau